MILRGMHVENWRCIRELHLEDLPEGIVVLHGPNRTGKSSLVLALRSCLFDSDHDTAGKEIKNSIPWGGNGPPKVVVEFATGGVTYRLTKVFSKKKEGTACLEKQVGSGWKVEQDAPKEAARRARELLGADKSTAGLNQLLWLSQGEIGLPEQKHLDMTLQEKLVGVLGVMVTGRDLAFRQSLDKRCGRWFTAGGKYKEGSSIGQWEKCKQERLKTRDDEKKKLELWEDAIRRMQGGEDELPGRTRAAELARGEVAQLRQEAEQSKERRRQYGEAENAFKTATQSLKQAEDGLEKYRAAQQRGREEERKVRLAREAVQAAQEQKDQGSHDHDEQVRLLESACQEAEKHQLGRDEIDDRRKLLTLAQQRMQLAKVLETIQNQEQEIAALENHLQAVTAPDEKTLNGLRANRRQSEGLRAQLAAAALTLAVTLRRPVPMQLGLDGQAAQPLDLPAGEKRVWSLRQRADIALDDIGIIELARTQENLDLERTAAELARLDRDYEEAVRSFQEKPADEACLDHLAEKRLQRSTWGQRLKDVRKELQQAAPDGRGALEAERDTLTSQQQIILQRRPDLAGWQPSAIEVEEGEQQFKKRSAALETLRKTREGSLKAAREKLQRAETELQTQKLKLAGAEASAKASGDELQRLGDEALLLASLEQQRQALARAEQALAKNQLTEAEKTIDQRCTEAETALEERGKRLRELEDQLTQLRGFLQGNEGLHTRLADAEAALQEAESAQARETLEADAHQRLRALFEECRENQVQQVMGPVAERVLEWSQKLGLNEYREVRFGDRFLPEGIVLDNGEPGQPIVFDDESYGTGEQLSLLVRLALGGILARDEPVVAILDDPLAHADLSKHRNILNILRIAAEGGPSWRPPAGRLQILIFTCHPDRFDHLPGARHINLGQAIRR